MFGVLGALAQTEKECIESPSKILMALGALVQTKKKCFESPLKIFGALGALAAQTEKDCLESLFQILKKAFGALGTLFKKGRNCFQMEFNSISIDLKWNLSRFQLIFDGFQFGLN